MTILANKKSELNKTYDLSAITNNKISWKLAQFNELSNAELYEALALRESIFVVEQSVPYLDLDGKDIDCTHILGYKNNKVVAYMRIVPLDLFEEGFLSIGRVVVQRKMRKTGIGRKMLEFALDYLDKVNPDPPIKISSQLYLKKFYESFGFESIGEPYIEDQILHIAMIRN